MITEVSKLTEHEPKEAAQVDRHCDRVEGTLFDPDCNAISGIDGALFVPDCNTMNMTNCLWVVLRNFSNLRNKTKQHLEGLMCIGHSHRYRFNREKCFG